MKGVKPKPTVLKLIDAIPNQPAKLKINKFEPKLTTGDLETAPDWLTETQKENWKYAIDNSPPGLLKKLDKSILLTWVVSEDLHRQACQAVAKSGMIVKSPEKGIPIQNPYMAIINRQATIMQKAACEMGFTPTSRCRISINEQAENDNPFLQNGRKQK